MVRTNRFAQQIEAETSVEGMTQELKVSLHFAEDPVESPLGFLRSFYRETVPIESHRPLTINGNPAVLANVDGTVTRLGVESEFSLSAVAIRLDPRTFVLVELRRLGGARSGDSVVVHQVATTVRVDMSDLQR